MGRPRALTEADEAEVVALIGYGIRRRTVAAVFSVSERTISRVLAARRHDDDVSSWRTGSLDELLAAVPSVEDVLAAPRPGPPRRRRSSDWRAIASRLEAEAPERSGRIDG